MNTSSVSEHTVFAHAQLLHNWQQRNNQGDIESRIMKKFGGVCYNEGTASDFISVL
jgi:hypothetical protein